MRDEEPSAPLRPLGALPRYFRSESERKGFVSSLFDAAAPSYDRASSVLSFGTDRRYRRSALLEHGLKPGMRMLDVACGTGLVSEPARDIVGAAGSVIGADISSGMLLEALNNGRLTEAVQGRAERLPFADESFDFLSMGYALRHVSDLITAFAEFRRVLRSKGRLLLLEITEPRGAVGRMLLRMYMRRIVPLVTQAVTRDTQARLMMEFYSDTVQGVVPPPTILAALSQVGFRDPERRVKLGIFSEYTAVA